MPAQAGVLSISYSTSRHRPFIQAVYIHGELRSVILDCPYVKPGEPCSIVRHALRHRKTGPTHPLAILRCQVHDCAFTVYPPGFTPYARRQVLEGPVQHDVPSLMQAVEDTATEGPRPRDATGNAKGTWSTQQRLILQVSRMFGLGHLDDQLRVANAFAIPLTDLVVAAQTYGVRDRATTLHELIEGLTQDDLLAMGALMGCWGRPHRWEPDRDQLIALNLSRGPPTTLGRSSRDRHG